MTDIKQLLELTVQRKASDLHVMAGVTPSIRIDGTLVPVAQEEVWSAERTEKELSSVLESEQLSRLVVNKELDFSLVHSNEARFRVNAYTQQGALGASFRRIPAVIPDIATLGLPKVCEMFTTMRQGLVLITGPTGHGKSTTLAAVLNEINKNRPEHIVTIEDPVEFIFKSERSIVSQREMGRDTHSWQIALRSVLREDPNVVLIGEMRDFETIASALTIAETGHLVFATLHTNSAAQTIDRIVDVFPEEQQSQVKLQLSNVLEAVFSMRLLPAIGGGRVVAYEVMLGTPAIRTVIREGKTHQIDNIIQTSSEIGMSTLESSMAKLIKDGVISMDVAQSYVLRPEELARLVRVGK